MDERVRRAAELYERAIFNGETGALETADRELDAAEADLALARGKVLHGRYLAERVEDPHELELFERALALYQSLADECGQAEAFFWIGCFHQVVRDDAEPAVSALRLSRELATKTGDELTLSYALRHLGIAAHVAGNLDEAGGLLEESTELRRTLGFTAGVAANLVGLIYLPDGDNARALADEATELAASVGAVAISAQVEEARSRL